MRISHDHIVSTGSSGRTTSIAGWFVALMVLLGSCADQPLDTGEGGTARIDTTVLVRTDTVIVNRTDTVIRTIRDTTFRQKTDTVEIIRVRRDTIRDTVRVKEVDTIEVPVNSAHFRQARVIYPAADVRLGRIDTVSFPATDHLAYSVVDSAGQIIGVGLSLTTPVPSQFRTLVLGSAQNSRAYRLVGLSLIVPLHRVRIEANTVHEVELDRHPFNAIGAGPGSPGGMAIRILAGQENEEIDLWTGQVFESDGQPGSDRFVNIGSVRFAEVDMRQRRLIAVVSAEFFIMDEVGGRTTPIRVPIRIEVVLGW